jgi:hypothetical protein
MTEAELSGRTGREERSLHFTCDREKVKENNACKIGKRYMIKINEAIVSTTHVKRKVPPLGKNVKCWLRFIPQEFEKKKKKKKKTSPSRKLWNK